MTNKDLITNLIEGYSYPQIAQIHNLPIWTIDRRVKSLKKRYGVEKTITLVALYVQRHEIEVVKINEDGE